MTDKDNSTQNGGDNSGTEDSAEKAKDLESTENMSEEKVDQKTTENPAMDSEKPTESQKEQETNIGSGDVASETSTPSESSDKGGPSEEKEEILESKAKEEEPEAKEEEKKSSETADKPEEESIKEESIKEEIPAASVTEDKNSPTEKSQAASENNESDTDNDSENENDSEDEEEIDYSSLNKEELVTAIKELSTEQDQLLKSYRTAQEIATHYDEIHRKERQSALDAFIKEGGKKEDFAYKNDELDNRFQANLKLISDKRGEFIRNREAEKEKNFIKKEKILEQLREFVDSDETNISFDTFKKLQTEWKETGPVPSVHNKGLWANYHALIDRFYDKRSIYFELKELDRKKNLEAKYELCERAEALAKVENLKEAIKELNELHEEFKHIGPVPKEEQEAQWNRFKAASDAVYARRKVFVENLKEELEANAAKKKVLIDKVQEFTSFNSDRIKEWNKKTTEILKLQKEWEAIGGIPRAVAKEMNRGFWKSFKEFFSNKNEFFKKLDEERMGNLEKKKVLIEQAVELQDSEDWDKTANKLKDLQQKWKDAGPVPEKYRQSSYAEFKKACDTFFDRRRDHLGNSEKQYQENLAKKEEICDLIDKQAGAEDASMEKLREMEKEFMAIGFVPKSAIGKIKKRFSKASEAYIKQLPDTTAEDKDHLLMKNEIFRIKNESSGGSNKLYRKEQDLRREIGKLENDMSLWKNNLEFFSASKTADKLKNEFNEKIENAEEEIARLKQQLRILRSNK